VANPEFSSRFAMKQESGEKPRLSTDFEFLVFRIAQKFDWSRGSECVYVSRRRTRWVVLPFEGDFEYFWKIFFRE